MKQFKLLYAFSWMSILISTYGAVAQKIKPVFQYTLTIAPVPANHYFHVQLNSYNWDKDTVNFKMPQWMPGYYQLMYYAKSIENFSATDNTGKNILVSKTNDNSWQIAAPKNKTIHISYDVKTDKQFVANSYVDSNHAYIIPAAAFLYADGYLNTAVQVTIIKNEQWEIATGLEPVAGKTNVFTAANFDILYDCPVLAGNLHDFASFTVHGIEHRFIAYKPGMFDEALFMQNLKKVVESAVAVIGDVPYSRYTFIGIGPVARGGIEHLNNTTVGFDGSKLNIESSMNSMMNFLAHEYFHHYNVKRIRPFELGPFDYDNANRTNLLWVSEGLSVYYEYMIVKRAGIVNEQTLFADFEKSIGAFENNPGHLYQSLAQASYETWSEGPFGKSAGKSISYYDKGPAVGLLLDFAIRHSTQNKKSLDDVMRLLYWQYYKKLGRGFTDAEFQQACETVAGISLPDVFEYVYTTKEPDYNTYLAYAGLRLDEQMDEEKKKRVFSIKKMENPTELQAAMLKLWLGQ